VHKHVRRLDANPDDPGEQAHHGVRSFLRRLLQSLQTGRLDRLDLSPDKMQARQITLQLVQRVRRQRHALWGAERRQLLGSLAQGRREAPDAEASQTGLHPIHDARAFANQVLALAVRTPGIFFLESRNRDHVAMVRLAAQPAEENALEPGRVEPVCFGPPMLARYGNARRVNDMSFNAVSPQPARQPEAIAAGLEGDGNASDTASG
jgi:hypothetical protein